jgi:outer membrane protein OmpA-like peptidoglycan-associated protein
MALVAALTMCAAIGYAQSRETLDPGYYLVVGAYAPSQEGLAKTFVANLEREGYHPGYGFHERSNLLLVYLSYFDNLKASLVEMQQVRQNNKYSNAWVRVVSGDIVKREPTNRPNPNPIEESTDNNTSVATTQAVPGDSATAFAPEDSIVVTDNDEIVQHEKMTLGNTEVFLSLYHARNNRIVDGMVKVVDTERAKELVDVKGNEYLLLPDPKSNSGQLTLICEAFGYRKLQYELNYPVPLADTVKPYIDLMGTTIVVNFDLVRYYKGDIATLYNVYFYNDASIMLPESRYELNSLLQLMQEGPDYKIRLHGHTNGSYHGKIVHMGPEKNYFSLDGSSTSVGSAKDLSRHRAEIIRDFLVSNGISSDRIEIKAWGGKRPLFDRNGQNARKNVRVEVEILEGQPI